MSTILEFPTKYRDVLEKPDDSKGLSLQELRNVTNLREYVRKKMELQRQCLRDRGPDDPRAA